MPKIDLVETQDELAWLREKLAIKATRLAVCSKRTIKRGEAYGCDFGYNIGAELRGYHPCVVLQSNSAPATLETLIVAPITHAASRGQIPQTLVQITTQKDQSGKTILEGYVNLSGIKAVSKARLTKKIASLPKSDLEKIDSEIATQLGIYHYYSDMENKLNKARTYSDSRDKQLKQLRALLQEIDDALGS